MKFLTINGKLQRDSAGRLITIPDNYDNQALTLNGKLLKTGGGIIGSNILQKTYQIIPSLTHVNAVAGNVSQIKTNETVILKYTAASGYALPDSVSVVGAMGVWNKTAGTLTLSNPTANVTFTIAGVEAIPSGYNVEIGVAFNQSDVKVYDGTSVSGTLLKMVARDTTETVICTTGHLYLVCEDPWDITTRGGVTYEGSGLFKVVDNGSISVDYPCMIEGTQITLADGSTKAVENITYDDELLVWNFYDGKFDTAKPSWIKIEQITPEYNLVKFSNGAEVGFVGPGGDIGYHRVFNKEAKAFTHTGVVDTPNGTTTFAQDGSYPTVVSQEVIEKPVKYYNVITDKHYNLFANGILTSCRLSNEYMIENMRYVGERLITDEQIKAYFNKIEDKRLR